MVYRLQFPLTKSTTFRVKIKDMIDNVLTQGVTGEIRDEHNANPIGNQQLSTRTMPLTGQRYIHRTNGWHVCKDFYSCCCNRTNLKEYPNEFGVTQHPNAGLTQQDVQQLNAAFGDDDELLFAISTIASVSVAGSFNQAFMGQVNQPVAPVLWAGNTLNDSVAVGSKATSIKIKKGWLKRPQIDFRLNWSRDDLFGTTMSENLFVRDLGVDEVTWKMRIVLKSSQTAVTFSTWYSYAQLEFKKRRQSLLSLSSASPDEMIETV